MKVISRIGGIKKKFTRPVLALGVFDGLHRGHRYLIDKVVKRARAIRGTSVVMTFFPHPRHVLRPHHFLPFLISLRHRLRLIEQMGVSVCFVANFTKQFSNLTSHQFARRYLLAGIKPREIFIGEDFRFGRGRSGSVEFLKTIGAQKGFAVHAIPRIKQGNWGISSSLIRKLILEGRLTLARRMLGRPVSILGKVIKGDGRGKTLGFPTANINSLGEIIPPCGIYAVNVILGRQMLKGAASIGYRPTFYKKRNNLTVEVFIFDFKKNIYGKEIEVQFVKKIRREKKFDSKEKLISQMKHDERKARSLLR